MLLMVDVCVSLGAEGMVMSNTQPVLIKISISLSTPHQRLSGRELSSAQLP